MGKSFVDEFEVKEEKFHFNDVPDYEAFENKELLDELRNKIIQSLIDNNTNNEIGINSFVAKQIDNVLEGYDLTVVERSYINNLIDNEINGYGPITELLEDPSITEIMVNGINEVYIELDGKIIKDDSVSFINDNHIIRTIQRLIQPIGRSIDTANISGFGNIEYPRDFRDETQELLDSILAAALERKGI